MFKCEKINVLLYNGLKLGIERGCCLMFKKNLAEIVTNGEVCAK